MTNIEAAIGLAQLERADNFLKRKINLAKKYIEGLKGLPIEFQNETKDTTHSFWMFSILVNRPEQRDTLRTHLSIKGIETRPLFYPLHTMPMYCQNYRKHKVAEDLAWRGINLPSWPGLSNEEINKVIEEIKNFYS